VDLKTIDAHVAGAPVRLVVGGLPSLAGETLEEHAQFLMASSGGPLLALAREPRAAAGTVVTLLVAPDRAVADAGMVFVSRDDLMACSGDALMAATAIALERGLVVPRRQGRLEIDTLAGPVSAAARGSSVSFTGLPAIVLRPNHGVTVGRRALHVDLVWTGWELAAIVDAEAAGAPLVASRELELQRAGRDLIDALDDHAVAAHPETGMRLDVASAVFIGAPPEQGADILSGSVHRDGRVERSPGAAAAVAITAVLSAMGVALPGQRIVHLGLAGTTLDAEISGIEERDGRALVTVEVGGDVWVTGEHTFATRDGDPLGEGLVL
jgi:proline racemase